MSELVDKSLLKSQEVFGISRSRNSNQNVLFLSDPMFIPDPKTAKPVLQKSIITHQPSKMTELTQKLDRLSLDVKAVSGQYNHEEPTLTDQQREFIRAQQT